jgi:hypothetical protein
MTAAGPMSPRNFFLFAILTLVLVGLGGLLSGKYLGSQLVCSLAEPMAVDMRLPMELTRFGRIVLPETLPGDAILNVCVGAFTLAGFTLAITVLGVAIGLMARWDRERTNA